MSEALRLFISYSHKDFSYAEALHKQLMPLRKNNLVLDWYDRNIPAGSHWEEQISSNLESTNVFLFLMSPDFFNSEYIDGIEMKRALAREHKGDATIIPVLVRPVLWEETPLVHFDAVPKTPDRQLLPVTQWLDPDEAWLTIVKDVRSLANRERKNPQTSSALAVSSQLDQCYQQSVTVLDNRARLIPLDDSTPATPTQNTRSVTQSLPLFEPGEELVYTFRKSESEVINVETRNQWQYSDASSWLEGLAEALVSWDLPRCQELIDSPYAREKDESYVESWRVFTDQQKSPRTIISLIQQTIGGIKEINSPHSVLLQSNLMALASRILLDNLIESRRYLKEAQRLGGESHLVAAAASVYWWKKKDLRKAQDFARESVRKAKNQPEGYIEWGIWAESEERWDDADSLFEQALDKIPTDSTPAWILDGPLAPTSGRFFLLSAKRLADQNEELALKIVDHAIKTGFKGHNDGVAIEAAAHHLRGDLLSKAGVKGSRVAEAYSNAGNCYYKAAQDAQAVSVLRRAVDENPDDFNTSWLLAEVLSWLSDDESGREGVKVWDFTYSQSPPSSIPWSAFRTKVRLSERIHGYAAPPPTQWESIVFLERAVALADDVPSLWLYLASHHRRLGNESIGLDSAERALALAPDNALALEERAMLLANMGQYSEAEVAINEILSRSDNTWARALRAWVLARTDRIDEATKILENSVKQDTNIIWYRELLNMCYSQKGEWDKAAQLDEWIFARSAENKKEDFFSYGWAALSMRHPAEARRYFDLAAAETSTDPFDTLSGSALTSFALGDLDEGKRLLRKAIGSASQRRQLDDFVAFTFPLVEHLESTWPYGTEALNYLRDTALGEIECQRKSLSSPKTPLEEIEGVMARFSDRVPVVLGPIATHARLLAQAGRTDEAAVLYEKLLAMGVFPEGRSVTWSRINGQTAKPRFSVDAFPQTLLG
jgi:tetratricopeptide (TPR) repeat protein